MGLALRRMRLEKQSADWSVVEFAPLDAVCTPAHHRRTPERQRINNAIRDGMNDAMTFFGSCVGKAYRLTMTTRHHDHIDPCQGVLVDVKLQRRAVDSIDIDDITTDKDKKVVVTTHTDGVKPIIGLIRSSCESLTGTPNKPVSGCHDCLPCVKLWQPLLVGHKNIVPDCLDLRCPWPEWIGEQGTHGPLVTPRHGRLDGQELV